MNMHVTRPCYATMGLVNFKSSIYMSFFPSVQLRFSKKATQFDEISQLIWRLLSKFQPNCEILSKFCDLRNKLELYCHSFVEISWAFNREFDFKTFLPQHTHLTWFARGGHAPTFFSECATIWP